MLAPSSRVWTFTGSHTHTHTPSSSCPHGSDMHSSLFEPVPCLIIVVPACPPQSSAINRTQVPSLRIRRVIVASFVEAPVPVVGPQIGHQSYRQRRIWPKADPRSWASLGGGFGRYAAFSSRPWRSPHNLLDRVVRLPARTAPENRNRVQMRALLAYSCAILRSNEVGVGNARLHDRHARAILLSCPPPRTPNLDCPFRSDIPRCGSHTEDPTSVPKATGFAPSPGYAGELEVTGSVYILPDGDGAQSLTYYLLGVDPACPAEGAFLTTTAAVGCVRVDSSRRGECDAALV